MALLISSVLTVVPAAAEGTADASGKKNVLANPRDDQMAGIGSSFYYDYHLYHHDIGQYPITDVVRPDGEIGYQGQRPYMLRSKNAAGGSAYPIDGRFDNWSSTYNTFNPSDELSVVTDCEGTVYDFDAWVGFSIRETATVDSFAFYTLNSTTKGGKLAIEELTIFGAVVDPAFHTYAPNSWFRMTETITDVQAKSSDDGQFALVTGNFDKPYDIDYIFLAFNLEGTGGGDYAVVELELYSYEGDFVDLEELQLEALYEVMGFAEEALANERSYTADSYAELKKMYQSAQSVLARETASQKMIDREEEKLYVALAALQEIADASGLVEELDKHKSLAETDYTASTWKVFSDVRSSANTLLNSGNASMASINEHIAKLAAAAAALEARASAELVASIEATVAEAGALDTSAYTTKSVTDLSVTMRDANLLLKKGAADISVKEAEAAVANIDGAIAALKEKADFAALQPVIDEALAINSKEYTAASFTALTEAITALQTFVAGNEDNAAAEEGEALVAAINTAKAALVKLADFTALDAKIAELEALVSTEYTADSWKTLADAIASAKALKATEATQDQADAALAAITAAAEALAKPTATEADNSDKPAAQGGCGGVVSVTAVAIVATLGLGFTALKRK